MAVILRNYNIIRVVNGDKIVDCTVVHLCPDYALIKYEGDKYKVPYHLIDKVVGHELLLRAE